MLKFLPDFSHHSFIIRHTSRKPAIYTAAAAAAAAKAKPAAQASQTSAPRPVKLSFKEKREMEQIEQEMEQLEQEKAQLEQELGSGTLPYDQLQQKSARIGEIMERTDLITMRWLELSEKA